MYQSEEYIMAILDLKNIFLQVANLCIIHGCIHNSPIET